MKAKRFKLPREVKIKRGKKFSVLKVAGFRDPLQLGECDDVAMTIKLHWKLRKKKLRHVFYHEVVHAFCMVHKIKLKSSEEERIATMLEPWLDTFFELNNLRFS